MSDLPAFDPKTIPTQGDQHDPAVRAKQSEFQKAFGDFKTRHVVSFWVGPAPGGEWVGLIFTLEDGAEVKVAVPFPLWERFGNEWVLAMMTAAELIQVNYGPADGSA